MLSVRRLSERKKTCSFDLARPLPGHQLPSNSSEFCFFQAGGVFACSFVRSKCRLNGHGDSTHLRNTIDRTIDASRKRRCLSRHHMRSTCVGVWICDRASLFVYVCRYSGGDRPVLTLFRLSRSIYYISSLGRRCLCEIDACLSVLAVLSTSSVFSSGLCSNAGWRI